jgi:hypothetical protein
MFLLANQASPYIGYYSSFDYSLTSSVWHLSEKNNFSPFSSILYKTSMILPSIFLLLAESFSSLCKFTLANMGILLLNGGIAFLQLLKSPPKNHFSLPPAVKEFLTSSQQHKKVAATAILALILMGLTFPTLRLPKENIFTFFGNNIYNLGLAGVGAVQMAFGLIHATFSLVPLVASMATLNALPTIVHFNRFWDILENSFASGLIKFLSPAFNYYHRVVNATGSNYSIIRFSASVHGTVPLLALFASLQSQYCREKLWNAFLYSINFIMQESW